MEKYYNEPINIDELCGINKYIPTLDNWYNKPQKALHLYSMMEIMVVVKQH